MANTLIHSVGCVNAATRINSNRVNGAESSCVPRTIDPTMMMIVPGPRALVEPVDIGPGGLLAKSGIAIAEMGDTNDDFVIVVASITVGY